MSYAEHKNRLFSVCGQKNPQDSLGALKPRYYTETVWTVRSRLGPYGNQGVTYLSHGQLILLSHLVHLMK